MKIHYCPHCFNDITHNRITTMLKGHTICGGCRRRIKYSSIIIKEVKQKVIIEKTFTSNKYIPPAKYMPTELNNRVLHRTKLDYGDPKPTMRQAIGREVHDYKRNNGDKIWNIKETI